MSNPITMKDAYKLWKYFPDKLAILTTFDIKTNNFHSEIFVMTNYAGETLFVHDTNRFTDKNEAVMWITHCVEQAMETVKTSMN